MGVNTRADELIGGVEEHIDDAIRDLLQVMNDDIWGAENYNSESLDKIYMLLREAKRAI